MEKVTFVCPCCGKTLVVTSAISDAVNHTETKSDKTYFTKKLQERGINTDKYFSVTYDGVTADDKTAEDEIAEQIQSDGYVNNQHLFRRWVFAQYAHMELAEGGYNHQVANLSTQYMLDVMTNEFYAQSKMADDEEYLAERKMFFNKNLLYSVIVNYRNAIHRAINEAERHTDRNGDKYCVICKTRVYINRVCDFIRPLNQGLDIVNSNPYQAMLDVKNFCIARKFNMKYLPVEFEEAYKKAGAFYSLKNLFLFHDCHIIDDDDTILTGEDAVKYITEIVPHMCGYKMVGILRDVLKQNDINLKEKIESWKKF